MQPHHSHSTSSFLLSLLLLVWWPSLTSAAEFRVNASADVNDLTPGNGLCVAYIIVIPPFVLPFCSLRGAIEETNKLPGADLITVPAGTFPLEIAGIMEDESMTGDFDITDAVTIRGAGADKTFIDARGVDRVFDLLTDGITVTLEDLTIMNGRLPPSLHWTQKGGAGLRSRARLTLRDVVIKNNRVNGSAPGDFGGGLFNQYQCTITKSTIEDNFAGTGGGIYNYHSADLTVSSSGIFNNISDSGAGLFNEGTLKVFNTTISGNTTRADQPHDGGGVYNTADLEILQSTIAANDASGAGGGIWNHGRLSLVNTLIADNGNGNCNPTASLLSLGHNLDSDNTCLLDGPADLVNADPRLALLADNGGPSRTHALLIGSPAIDSGLDLSQKGITTDQRGNARPDGDGYDIGAYETRKKMPPSALAPLLL